ncbi:50S ribosomal protein L34e [Candidatus Woesearchaeota archaeon]|nr:50S ribosomal protein L34e [Candidatus Woesearchaeota archaeon]
MPRGQYKSGRFNKIKVKTPGGKTVIHYRESKPAKKVCKVYGTVLAGVPHASATRTRNMPKSHKRPERPYGGVLSSKAMRETLRAKARSTASSKRGEA